MNERRDHWNKIYSSKGERDVSWFEVVPSTSLAMLDAVLTKASCVIDIGGGESYLVDHLIERGLRCLAVLDISSEALARARARLGDAGSIPEWITADVAGEWSVKPMDVWHDRAVFHFLTDPRDRDSYVAHLKATVKPGGAVILATFAPDGPEKCSGLPVVRYSPETLALALGDEFTRVEAVRHEHRTPWGAVQPFTYVRFVRARSVERPMAPLS